VTTRPIALARRRPVREPTCWWRPSRTPAFFAFTGSATAGTWTLIPSPAIGGPTVSPGDIHGVSLSWAEDGSAMYMYDEGTHAVWMSSVTRGVFSPWVECTINTSLGSRAGWVAGDPTTPAQVWVADSNGLGAVDTGACASHCTPAWEIVSSGASGVGGPLGGLRRRRRDGVDMAGGGTQRPLAGAGHRLRRRVSGGHPGRTSYYASVTRNATALAVGGDGTVYVATLGTAVAVGSQGGG